VVENPLYSLTFSALKTNVAWYSLITSAPPGVVSDHSRGIWIGASPDYFTATHGTIAGGTATGNLAYASICFGVVTLAVCTVSVKSRGGLFLLAQR
jgi:hypothetical protein